MIENVHSMTRPLSEKPASSFPPWHGSIEYNLFAQHARISSLVKSTVFFYKTSPRSNESYSFQDDIG